MFKFKRIDSARDRCPAQPANRRWRFPRVSLKLICLGLVLFTSAAVAHPALPQSQLSFEREIQPILNDHCAGCHGGVKKSGGFSVVSRDLMLSPTDSGTIAVVPGRAADSELIRRLRSKSPDDQMPPEGHDRLTETEIGNLEAWIDNGAVWPTHWAYQQLPESTEESTEEAVPPGMHPVDYFVQRRLSEVGIAPSPTADRRTLLRRLSLDLTGLNPDPESLSDFEADESSDAFVRHLDRLLASPHFGERWARHWLDEARYADSEGYEKDSVKDDAWRFRDWVIQAINDDLPFDDFTRKQIAGDLLPDASDDDRIATKFHLQAQFNLEGGVDSEEDRTKRVTDQISTVASVWLGSSLGCCQCHDHPYDGFRQRDFYGLYAFFNNTDFAAAFLNGSPPDADKILAERHKKWDSISDLLRRQVDDKNLSDDVQSQLSGLRTYDNSKGLTRFLQERAVDRRPTWIFTRGDFLQPDKTAGEIAPAVPSMLPPLRSRGSVPDRLDLANWLVDSQNPLTARVEVNKVWLHLFGQPLAEQPQEFGSRGAAPSHPELLDYLATWFVHEAHWSRKQLIRLIVTSQTWQQTSVNRPELLQIDPANRLLSRQNRWRVEAELIRDLSLQAAGLLNEAVGGRSVFPPLPAIIAEQTYAGSFKFRASEGPDRYRRGMYTFFRRTAIDPNLSTFDCPDSSLTSAKRDRSNNPLQALAALHNEVFHEAAQAFTARLLREGLPPVQVPTEEMPSDEMPSDEMPSDGMSSAQKSQDGENYPDVDSVIDRAFLLTTGRPGTESERSALRQLQTAAVQYFQKHPEEATQLIGTYRCERVNEAENAAWVATLRVMLNLDEFLTRS